MNPPEPVANIAISKRASVATASQNTVITYTFQITNNESSALGLTISQRLLEQMGSTLQWQSEVGQGSTFRFDLTLPLVAPSAVQPAARLLAGDHGPRQLALIVDDEAHNRRVLAAMLETAGFQVIAASDGAVAQAQIHQPRLICLDLMMPVMNGFAALLAIRQLPALADSVIIAVSASTFVADQERCLAAGFDAFLPKPVDWQRLNALLVEQLDLDCMRRMCRPPCRSLVRLRSVIKQTLALTIW